MVRQVTADLLVSTHRLQPLHLGHVYYWHTLLEMYPGQSLIICILKNLVPNSAVETTEVTPRSFATLSNSAFSDGRNPIPNWERYCILSKAVAADPILARRCYVLIRNRADIAWEASIEDLPTERKWVFNIGDETEFTKAKIEFYSSKGENIDTVDVPRYKGYNSSEIRDRIRNGSEDYSFLPGACEGYFKENVLRYFRKETIKANLCKGKGSL